MKLMNIRNGPGRSSSKLQSAMEFLMTYGWSILIICVVLAILFKLGAFGSLVNPTSTTCLTLAGFTCQTATLTPDGYLTFVVGQATGGPLYNVEFACSGSTTSGLPNPIFFNSIMTTGTAQPALPAATAGNTLANVQVLTISGLSCYDPQGNSVAGSAIGAAFRGYVWLNYTSRSGAPSAANHWVSVRAITLRTVVT
jgi:hypothetical protein